MTDTKIESLGLVFRGDERFDWVCLEFWLHLISRMGSEYSESQPLIIGLVVFFSLEGRNIQLRNKNPGSMV